MLEVAFRFLAPILVTQVLHAWLDVLYCAVADKGSTSNPVSAWYIRGKFRPRLVPQNITRGTQHGKTR